MSSFKPPIDVGMNSLKTLGQSFKDYPMRSVLVIVMICLAGVFESVGILMIIPLLNFSLVQQDYQSQISENPDSMQAQFFSVFEYIGIEPSLPILLGALVGMLVLKSAFTLGANYYLGTVFAAVVTDLRVRLMRGIIGASWGFLTAKQSGLYVSAVTQESQRAASSYVAAWNMIGAFIQAGLFFVASAVLSFEILATGLFAGLVVLGMLQFTVRMARSAGEQETEDMNAMLVHLSDTIAGIKPLKAMGLEKQALPYLEKYAQGVFNARRKLSLSMALHHNLAEPLMMIILACGCYYAMAVLNLNIAYIAVIVIFFNRMMGRLTQMQKHYQGMSNYASAYRFVKNLTYEAEYSVGEPVKNGQTPSLERSIQLENVSLSYDDRYVLRDFSAEFPARKITALIGPSGVGKTSIADIVTGLVQPQEGRVLIDGLSLKDANLNAWRGMIGYVPQELFLFHDSLKNNITLRDDNYSDEDVWAALDQCHARAFVEALPEQLETVIGEKGAKLSGGQRQRVMIARALVRRPKLLILDEATTGLDPETEKILLQVIREISEQTTILAISHQPGLKAIADQIIDLSVMDEKSKSAKAAL